MVQGCDILHLFSIGAIYKGVLMTDFLPGIIALLIMVVVLWCLALVV